MTTIQFVRNYSDLSTDRGFQFEFFCDRCSSGHRTHFQTSKTGLLSEALDTAGGFLGGVLGRAADISERVHSAAWEKAHDAAFTRAVEETKAHFRQCPRCTSWVCLELCWNQTRGLCKDCAPDLAVEMSSMQAEAAVTAAREKAHAAESEQVSAEDFEEVIRATCPECGSPVAGGKFCANCGAALAAVRFCVECGSKIPTGVKFCPECGSKQSGK
jgi:membrane protease subunit (stomatin/prohibitin family)